MPLTLPTSPNTYSRAAEQERSRKLEAADRENWKRNQNIQIAGGATLSYQASDGSNWSFGVNGDGSIYMKNVASGEVVPVGGGGQNQTPWLSDIDAAGYSLHNLAAGTNPNDAVNLTQLNNAIIGGGGGGSQTPWLSDIDGSGYRLLHAGDIQTGAPAGPNSLDLQARFTDGYGLSYLNTNLFLNPSSFQLRNSSYCGWSVIASAASDGSGGWSINYVAPGQNNLTAYVTLDEKGYLGLGGDYSPQVPLDVSGVTRISHANVWPASGTGVEIGYIDGSYGICHAYDRDTNAFVTMHVDGNPLCLNLESGAPVELGGVIDMQSHRIIDLANGVNPNDAVNLSQMQSAIAGGGAVSSVFGRTGAVVAATGDYTASMVTNAVDSSQAYANPTWITSLDWSKITGVPAGFGQTPWLSDIDGGGHALTNVDLISVGGLTGQEGVPLQVGSWHGTCVQLYPGSGETNLEVLFQGNVRWNVGVGTDSASYGADLFYFMQDGGPIALCLDDNNHVGIGNTAPAYALDIAGDCNITGVYRVNGVPISTGVSSVFGRTGAVVAAAGDYTAAEVTNAVDSTQSYANPAWITSLAWSKITGAPAAYVLPPATASLLGGVKIGSGITVQADGTISTTAGGGGTVTSVALAMPAEFSVTGSPVTTTGTLTVAKATQAANLVYAGPASGSAVAPAFRALAAADLPAATTSAVGAIQLARDLGGTDTAPKVIGIQGVNVSATAPTNGQVLQYVSASSNWAAVTPSSGGSVTSVALTMPAEFAVAGSPITTSGTLAVTKATQSANLVYAGPASGVAAAPAFRALAAADLPSGTGTVTSVALTMPSDFTVGGSPVTTSGTLAVTRATQAKNLVLAGPASGSNAVPTYRALVAADLPSGIGTGTVTSVALTMPAEFTVGGSPVTSSGTLAVSKATQAANLVYAGPASGSAAAPTFRALAAADFPAAAIAGFQTPWLQNINGAQYSLSNAYSVEATNSLMLNTTYNGTNYVSNINAAGLYFYTNSQATGISTALSVAAGAVQTFSEQIRFSDNTGYGQIIIWPPTDAKSLVRVMGLGSWPTSGSGLELVYDSRGSVFQSYNRTANSWQNMLIDAAEIQLNSQSGGIVYINSTNPVEPPGTVMAGGLVIDSLQGSGTAVAIQAQGNNTYALNVSTNGSWQMYDYASGQWLASICSSSGRIGIGNTTPQFMLDITGGSLGTTQGNAVNLLNLYNTNSNASRLQIWQFRSANGSDWNSATTRIQQSTDGVAQCYIDFNPPGGPSAMGLGTGGGEMIRIATNNCVGINTTAPQYTLHVNGNIGIPSGQHLYMQDTNQYITTGSNQMTFADWGATFFWYNSSNSTYFMTSDGANLNVYGQIHSRNGGSSGGNNASVTFDDRTDGSQWVHYGYGGIYRLFNTNISGGNGGDCLWINKSGYIGIGSAGNLPDPLTIQGTGSSGQIRMINSGGNYGAIFLNDGGNLWTLITNSGNPYGAFNGLRPFSIGLGNGLVTIGAGAAANIPVCIQAVTSGYADGDGFLGIGQYYLSNPSTSYLYFRVRCSDNVVRGAYLSLS